MCVRKWGRDKRRDKGGGGGKGRVRGKGRKERRKEREEELGMARSLFPRGEGRRKWREAKGERRGG